LIGADIFQGLNVFELLDGGFGDFGWFLGVSGENRDCEKIEGEKYSYFSELPWGNGVHP
jgi:hypothetical protein